MSEDKDTFTLSTPTEDILKFAEMILFNDENDSAEDIMQATLVSLYGSLVVLHLAGYDKDQLVELLKDTVDTAYPMLQDVRAEYLDSMKRIIN